jgi:hypothetical protein
MLQRRPPGFLQGMIVSMNTHCASVKSVVNVLIPVSKISSAGSHSPGNCQDFSNILCAKFAGQPSSIWQTAILALTHLTKLDNSDALTKAARETDELH